MFQYAFGKSLSYLHNTEVKYDLSSFEQPHFNQPNLHRKYELDCFDIEVPLASHSEIKTLKKKNNLIQKLFNIRNSYVVEQVAEFYRYNPKYLQLKGPIYFDGYWQCLYYLRPIKHKLKTLLKFKNKPSQNTQNWIDAIKNKNAVGLHIRRTDYVQPRFNMLVSDSNFNYYKQAIAKIYENVSDPYFFIFSDELSWVKKKFNLDIPMEIVEGNHANLEELRMMTHCKHNIIANSTFSWWGAYLNNNPEKIVVAPKTWWNESDSNDIIPSEWITLAPC